MEIAIQAISVKQRRHEWKMAFMSGSHTVLLVPRKKRVINASENRATMITFAAGRYSTWHLALWMRRDQHEESVFVRGGITPVCERCFRGHNYPEVDGWLGQL
jgi:hypothetical protein